MQESIRVQHFSLRCLITLETIFYSLFGTIAHSEIIFLLNFSLFLSPQNLKMKKKKITDGFMNHDCKGLLIPKIKRKVIIITEKWLPSQLRTHLHLGFIW